MKFCTELNSFMGMNIFLKWRQKDNALTNNLKTTGHEENTSFCYVQHLKWLLLLTGVLDKLVWFRKNHCKIRSKSSKEKISD